MGGVRVECADQSAVALVVRGSQAITEQQTLLINAAVPVLTTLLERREAVRAGQADSAVIATAERRLARLRFDLHDGPQQDVMLLADDLRALRSQLGSVLKSRTARKRLLGTVDDLEARLVALDGDLRRISLSVESPFLQPTSLPEALAQLTDDFASRTGIQPEIRLRGRFAGLSDSQHITLLGPSGRRSATSGLTAMPSA